MKREMQEAVQAGERVLQTLYAARDKLGSARNWGIFDMLGGGFISDLVKHSKMNDASALMEQAKSDIQRFQRELRDVLTPKAEFLFLVAYVPIAFRNPLTTVVKGVII